MRQIISKTVNQITGFKSKTYAALYLLSIPIFGFVYAQMPLHFYSSTIKHEPLFNSERLELAESIRKYLQSNYDNSIKPKLVSLYNSIPIIKIFVDSVEYDENKDSIFFNTGILPLFTKHNENDLLDTSLTCKVEMLKYNELRIGPSLYIYNRSYPIKVSQVQTFSTSYKWMNESILFGDKLKDSYYMGNIPDELEEKVFNFISTAKGFPVDKYRNLIRMNYFSIVTITTLGYGDIAPVSSLSRALVGFESIWGIVMIGLFINSLSSRVREGSGRSFDREQAGNKYTAQQSASSRRKKPRG